MFGALLVWQLVSWFLVGGLLGVLANRPEGRGGTARCFGASGTTTYGYDSMDRLTSKQTPAGTLTYTYDGAGHVATMQSSNANGVNVSYTYDRLRSATSFFSGAFSSRSRLASCASLTSMPPYFDFQA